MHTDTEAGIESSTVEVQGDCANHCAAKLTLVPVLSISLFVSQKNSVSLGLCLRFEPCVDFLLNQVHTMTLITFLQNLRFHIYEFQFQNSSI